MELAAKIKESVIVLAREKGIEININIKKIEDSELGYTKYEPHQRLINIVIKDSATDREEVLIHELMHAKLVLLDYPYIQFYSLIPMHPLMHQIMGSLINSVEHTFVFSEMKKLGVTQEKIDAQFIENIKHISETVVSEGVAKLSHTVNFLELYLRSPNTIEEIKHKISVKQADAYSLFLKMKKVIVGINSPFTMREAYVRLIRLVDEFVFIQSGEKIHFNTILNVSPVFEEEILNQRASDILYTVKIQGYPHVFVLDKKNKQCCLFLSNQGKNLEVSQVNEILSQHSVREIFNF